MDRLPRFALACVLCAASVGIAAPARAEPSGGTGAKWLVATKGEGCASRRHALEEEIALACTAIGGSCRLVDKDGDAELVALLDCTGSRWQLVTRTVEGARLSQTDLEGDEPDRVRQAAMEVARDAAPEHVLAARALENTLQKDHVAAPPTADTARFGVALGGRVFRGAMEDTGYGGRFLGGYRISSAFAITLGAAAEVGGSGVTSFRLFRGGPGAVIGAPFGGGTEGGALRHFGIAVEAGWAMQQSYVPVTRFDEILRPLTRNRAYGQATLFAQTNLRGLRGFAGLTVMLLDQGGADAAGAFDIGAAFTGL
jgi:hypothetical protein